ncbi:hypothetical protein WA158_004103 [Blastocystis sp. Blastoise]
MARVLYKPIRKTNNKTICVCAVFWIGVTIISILIGVLIVDRNFSQKARQNSIAQRTNKKVGSQHVSSQVPQNTRNNIKPNYDVLKTKNKSKDENNQQMEVEIPKNLLTVFTVIEDKDSSVVGKLSKNTIQTMKEFPDLYTKKVIFTSKDNFQYILINSNIITESDFTVTNSGIISIRSIMSILSKKYSSLYYVYIAPCAFFNPSTLAHYIEQLYILTQQQKINSNLFGYTTTLISDGYPLPTLTSPAVIIDYLITKYKTTISDSNDFLFFSSTLLPIFNEFPSEYALNRPFWLHSFYTYIHEYSRLHDIIVDTFSFDFTVMVFKLSPVEKSVLPVNYNSNKNLLKVLPSLVSSHQFIPYISNVCFHPSNDFLSPTYDDINPSSYIQWNKQLTSVLHSDQKCIVFADSVDQFSSFIYFYSSCIYMDIIIPVGETCTKLRTLYDSPVSPSSSTNNTIPHNGNTIPCVSPFTSLHILCVYPPSNSRGFYLDIVKRRITPGNTIFLLTNHNEAIVHSIDFLFSNPSLLVIHGNLQDSEQKNSILTGKEHDYVLLEQYPFYLCFLHLPPSFCIK